METINFTWSLGIFCFMGMVTREPSNVTVHAKNTVLFNDPIIEQFLCEHCKLEELQGHFFSYVLSCQGHGDVVLKDRKWSLEEKWKMELATHDITHQAFGQSRSSSIHCSVSSLGEISPPCSSNGRWQSVTVHHTPFLIRFAMVETTIKWSSGMFSMMLWVERPQCRSMWNTSKIHHLNWWMLFLGVVRIKLVIPLILIIPPLFYSETIRQVGWPGECTADYRQFLCTCS